MILTSRQTAAPRGSRPAFGLLSLMFPTGIALLWSVVGEHAEIGNRDGYTGLLIAGFLYVGTFLFCATGIALGIAGLLKRERPRILSVIGIMLNFYVGFSIYR